MSTSSTSCASVDVRGVGRTLSMRRGQEEDLAVLLVTWGKCCAGSELWAIPRYV